MKVWSKKPRGQRIFKARKKIRLENGRIGRRPYWIEPVGHSWMFIYDIGQWVQNYEGESDRTTSYYSMRHEGYHNVWSLRAAMRLIKKWDIPKGTKFIVSLPYVGHEFIVTKK